jgi:nucleoside-diphosphate-sugar epimerase
MSDVLVTGATGFIGLHLVEALVRRGERVRCLVRRSSRTEALGRLGVELAIGDLDQLAGLEAALADVGLVYHVAGIKAAFSLTEFERINRDGTARLAAACASLAQPPRLVYVSSISATGPAPRGQLRVESDPPAPLSLYGLSKRAGELALARHAGQVPTTIVRPGIVFGPRDRDVLRIMQFIQAVRCHISPGLHPPALSYIHVADLVELVLRAGDRGARLAAIQNGKPGQGQYFAVAAEHPTYAELGKIVRPMLKRPYAPVIPIPGPVAWCVAGMTEGLSRWRGGRTDALNLDKIREALCASWACSGEAARRELDFVPAAPLAERLRETIEWYRCEGWI